MSNNKGFSLIELMIVVAIIGILSAVAVPNFQKFQRKARTTEAKAAVAAIYSAQKAFHAEFANYYTNLSAVGYEPEGNMRYVVGFDAASAATTQPSVLPASAAPTIHLNTKDFCTATGSSAGTGSGANCAVEGGSSLLVLAAATPGDYTATDTTFLVGSIGNIGGANADEWTLDQGKNLVNVVNGTL